MKNHFSIAAKLFYFLFTLSLLLPLNGCDNSNAGAKGAWPKRITIAFSSSSEDDPEGRFVMYQELGRYLEKEIGVPVKVIRNLSYAPVIEAMRSGKVDVAQAGPFSYVIAHQKAGVEPLVARGTLSGGLGLYTSIIATSPKTGFNSLDEIMSKSKDLVFSFVDPASTSGHLIPRAGLESMNIDVDRDFKQVVYAMNHTNSAMTILSAKVDAGAMSRSTLDRLIIRGKVKPEDLKILWESKPIPPSPIIVRKDLPKELKQRITAAFLKLNEGGPLLEQLAIAANKPDLQYYEVDDSLYDGLRDIARNLENMQLLSTSL